MCATGTGHTCSHGGRNKLEEGRAGQHSYPCLTMAMAFLAFRDVATAHGLPLRPFYNNALCPINNHSAVICPYHYSSHPCIQLVFHACVRPHVNVRSCLMFNLASCYALPRSFCLVDNYVTFKGRLGDE